MLSTFSVNKADGYYVCKKCSYRGHVSEFKYSCPQCGNVELEDESLYICPCCNQCFDWADFREHLKNLKGFWEIEVVYH